MGWTEKQLKEDNTLEFLQQINVYLSEKAKAEKVNQAFNKVHEPHIPPRKGRR